jgi:hypothetical protein
LIVGWSVTTAMLCWYYASQNDPQGGISFTAVGLPGPILSLAVAFLLSRARPRWPDSDLQNLTFWTIVSKPQVREEHPNDRSGLSA